MNWRVLTDKNSFIWYIVFLSLVLKLIYVFQYSDFANYLFSDCAGYWHRALERLGGDYKNPNQWAIWPPYYHMILAEILRLIEMLGLFAYKLKIVIGLNIILSTISVYLLYLIAVKLTKSLNISLITAGAYAFSYPYIYFNSFVLSEHLGIFTLILSVYLLFKDAHKLSRFNAGMALGFSVACRPAFGLLGLPFFLYVLFSEKLSKKSLKRAIIFALGFFMFIGAVSAMNGFMSNGKLQGPGSNGGVNFYFAQCKTFKLISNHNGLIYYLVPPVTVKSPENGIIEVNQPFYNQKYFYQQGLMCIKEDPGVLIKNAMNIHLLFFSPLFPSSSGSKWFTELFPISRYLLMFMFLSLGLTYILFKDKNIDIKRLLLIISIPAFSLLIHYFWGWEHRYIYSFGFSIYLLFFAIIFNLFKHIRAYKKDLIIYFSVILLIFVTVFSLNYFKKINMKENIKTVITANKDNIRHLHQKRSPLSSKTVYIDTLEFNNNYKLDHVLLGDLGYIDRFFMDFETNFEVLKEGLYKFDIYSNDGFSLHINDKKVAEYFFTKPDVSMNSGYIYLKKGNYKLKGSFFQNIDFVAMKVYYRNLTVKKSRKYALGRDSEFIRFEKFESISKDKINLD